MIGSAGMLHRCHLTSPKGGKNLKKKDKIFLVCIILIIILSALCSLGWHEYAKRQEEIYENVKELQRKTQELKDAYMAQYHWTSSGHPDDDISMR